MFRKRTLTTSDYFHAKQLIDKRYDVRMQSLFLMSAILNTIAVIVTIMAGIVDEKTQDLSVFHIVQIFFFLLAYFIRETVCLIILFFQVAQVNEAGKELVLCMTKTRWTEDWIMNGINDEDDNNSHGKNNKNTSNGDIRMTNSPLLTSTLLASSPQQQPKSVDIKDSVTETERFSLALAASHHIIGSQDFSYRPSKHQLMLQITGVIFTIACSVFIRIIAAWVVS